MRNITTALAVSLALAALGGIGDAAYATHLEKGERGGNSEATSSESGGNAGAPAARGGRAGGGRGKPGERTDGVDSIRVQALKTAIEEIMNEPDANAEEKLAKMNELTLSAIASLEKIMAAPGGMENTDWDEDFE